MVIWVTGLSGSGKTTLCNALWELLKPKLPQLVVLDGDSVRQALGDGLGYREEDRVVQIGRLQSLARMLSQQGLVVLVAALYSSPELMAWNRQNIPHYFEIYLEASLKSLKERDYKGLYKGATKGSIPNVVGVDIPWHAPEAPDLVINTERLENPEVLGQQVVAAIPNLEMVQVGS